MSGAVTLSPELVRVHTVEVVRQAAGLTLGTRPPHGPFLAVARPDRTRQSADVGAGQESAEARLRTRLGWVLVAWGLRLVCS